jgi:hypothetical protein
MARMSTDTIAQLRLAVADPVVVGRYWSHIKTGRTDQCWLWTGAISGKGHGRFQIADQRLTLADGTTVRRTYVVIAHRFGYAALHGVDALLDVPLLAHACDNPICQNPRCWRESNHRANGQDYAHRRDIVRGALADTRGAGGRARAVRDAAKDGAEISQAVLAGLRPVHFDQLELFVDIHNPSPDITSRSSTTPPGKEPS